MKVGLAVKKTTKEAWDAVKAMRVGDDRVKAASTQRLWKEFENFWFRDGECVDDAAVRINVLVASLREMGETLEDHRVVKKLLRVVPRKFKQVAVAIEMLTDLNTATIEEFVGRLRVAEDADKEDAQEVAEGGGCISLRSSGKHAAGSGTMTGAAVTRAVAATVATGGAAAATKVEATATSATTLTTTRAVSTPQPWALLRVRGDWPPCEVVPRVEEEEGGGGAAGRRRRHSGAAVKT
ncbi:hypothetical protein U9M48_027460 [Paspalum notatum var. saurae]|uniref:Uncharacterized protein n=1 Tax=Paspalum notatum var. saurae TaxID=547442 RepID=A0AAQ3TUW7_PASNO